MPAAGEATRGCARLREGEVAIIASGQPHTFAWRAPTLVSCVYVEPAHLDEMGEAIGVPKSAALSSCFGLADALARELIVALGREAANGFPLGRTYADSLEQALLLGALRRHAPARPSFQPSLAPQRLRAVLEFMEAHFAEDIGLAELAAAAGISRFHFARAFKAATGCPPCRCLLDRRIREAKRLLASDLPLSAIAAAVGFSDQSHFTARFRACVGMPPNAYRRASR